jgi:hypothetical protein
MSVLSILKVLQTLALCFVCGLAFIHYAQSLGFTRHLLFNTDTQSLGLACAHLFGALLLARGLRRRAGYGPCGAPLSPLRQPTFTAGRTSYG